MRLLQSGIRAEIDIRNEKLGLKVREAQLQKIPYMIVIGDKEEEQRTVSPRTRRGENLGVWSVPQLIERIKAGIGSGKKWIILRNADFGLRSKNSKIQRIKIFNSAIRNRETEIKIGGGGYS